MSLKILLDVPEEFHAEANYTFDNIFFPFECDVDVTRDINNLKNHPKNIIYCHQRSPYLFNSSLTKNTIFVLLEEETLSYFSKFQKYDKEKIRWDNGIPELFPLQRRPSKTTFSGYIFPFDIFAASYFFLSCWQENGITSRDQMGRIPLKDTLQYQLGIIRKPIVNQYLQLLDDFMQNIWGERQLIPKKMPGGGSVYVALSHDIDYVKINFSKYLQLLRQKRHDFEWTSKNLWGLIRNAFGQKYLNQKIIELEKTGSANSTNYVFSKYPLLEDEKYLQQLIDYMEINNFEVGHHISDQSILKQDLDSDFNNFRFRLRKKLEGERVHTLRFEVQTLFSQLEKNEYKYDNSLLFAEDLGYRTGFTFPHYIFDVRNKRPFNVVAIPLNIMDTTLSSSKYLSLSDKQTESELKSFLAEAITFNGAISILFHNNYFMFNTASKLKIYRNILKFLSEKNVSIGCCNKLYYWRKEGAIRKN